MVSGAGHRRQSSDLRFYPDWRDVVAGGERLGRGGSTVPRGRRSSDLRGVIEHGSWAGDLQVGGGWRVGVGGGKLTGHPREPARHRARWAWAPLRRVSHAPGLIASESSAVALAVEPRSVTSTMSDVPSDGEFGGPYRHRK